MQAILGVTIPFFALVLCGYLAARFKVLPAAAIPGLNVFVLLFALPCLLFRFGASLPAMQVLNPTVLAVYLGAGLPLAFIVLRYSRSERVQLKDAAFGALATVFPNTGFMGVPLLPALLGVAAAGPVITAVVADMLVTTSILIAIAQTQHTSGGGVRAAALRALVGALRNPLPWAIALGMALAASTLKLPSAVDTVIKMLADAATPVALFTIGAVLGRPEQSAQRRTPLALYLPLALTKLIVHPAVVFAVGTVAILLGAGLSSFSLAVLVLAAALPSASNVSILAERYGADSARIAHIVLASTAIGFLSFSAIAWLFEVSQ